MNQTHSELIQQISDQKHTIILSPVLVNGKEIASDAWVFLQTKIGVVEGKFFLPTKTSETILIFEPGFPGGGSTQFEQLWLSDVLQAGYAVFLARHGGTLTNGKFSHDYLNCPERQKLARKLGEDVLGIKKEHTMSDWLVEPFIAMDVLLPHFQHAVLVGHSFGPLAIFSSLLDFAMKQPKLAKRIYRFVSLAGTLGRVRGDDEKILTVWREHLITQWERDRVSVGDPDHNVRALHEAYDRIHEEAGTFPKHIEFVAAAVWGDRAGTTDELVHPIESVDMIARLGRGYLILDKTEWTDQKAGRMAHDMEALSGKALVQWVDSEWLPDQQITVLSPS